MTALAFCTTDAAAEDARAAANRTGGGGGCGGCGGCGDRRLAAAAAVAGGAVDEGVGGGGGCFDGGSGFAGPFYEALQRRGSCRCRSTTSCW